MPEFPRERIKYGDPEQVVQTLLAEPGPAASR